MKALRNAIDGVLLLDKPQGPTSAAVLNTLKFRFRPEKIGHAGTLDPLATGLLPVCLGEGTKLATHLGEARKRYLATAVLGLATDTQDRSGQTIFSGPVPTDYEARAAALSGFLGSYSQLPPMYSAKKHEGRALYELARAGEELERAAVELEIYELRILEQSATRMVFEVEASKGFYVRTLCHDLGLRLGCGAHLGELRRLTHGSLRLSEATPLDELLRLSFEEFAALVRPLEDPGLGTPLFTLPESALKRVSNGHPLPLDELPEELAASLRGAGLAQLWRALSPKGRILALMRLAPDGQSLNVERGFAAHESP